MRAFGPRAARWSSVLPADLPVLAVDEAGVAEAFRAAVDLRARAEPFFVWVCVPDITAHMATRVSPHMRAGHTYDQQRVLFEQVADGSLIVNGMRVDALSDAEIAAATSGISQLLRLADGLFATSRAAAERVQDVYEVTLPHVAVAALPRPNVPSFVRASRGRWIVVWADGIPLAETSLIGHALEEMRLPVLFVADGGTVYAPPGAAVPGSLPALLREASAIVDASLGDPADALALAAGGVPLAVARTSGAHEHIDGAIAYDPRNWKSVYEAVARALGAPRPRVHDLGARLAAARATIADAGASPPVAGPLVSVVIPTYNRRDRLPSALASIFAQQYRNLEVIVVNDGGAAVDDIVAEFPPARLISYAQNGGVEHAINTGYAAATGAYVTHISDDDAFYPDHIARLIDACETSGCAIAHGNTLIRYLRERDGALELEGFGGNVFMHALEKTESYTNCPVAGHSFVIRRDVGETLGWYDESLPVLGDQEMQTRYAKAYDFVHVDRMTNEWRYVGGDANLSSRKARAIPGAMRAWYALHPSDRPLIAAARESALAKIEERGGGYRFPPTVTYPPGTPAFSPDPPAGGTRGSDGSSRK